MSRLRSRLLRSPERIRSTIVGLQATLEREKDNVAGLERKERELVGKLSSLKKYQSVRLSLPPFLPIKSLKLGNLGSIAMYQDYGRVGD